ncbi:serine hydrolase domain-containing protein [Nocardia caishijiensis]|uniref:CubicO group peptidase (Beta-lactamase class C family) n=1 Tax=Nocardia caishijiensis TaxID=184756 RepID=A0ABQ6YUK7_9NOCA|nr:serine hydrolase domain-containing protein [Nocardia caishijiensis]KAF0849488.1 CubicO group peptidase (beta-lactamase class C family) [Nocardia caishijiensis]
MVSATAGEPGAGAPTAPRQMRIDPRFIRLADHFFGMFQQPSRGGGALAIYLDGRPVVDIWAGWAAKDQRWNGGHVALTFSTGKGVAATVLHRVAERGLIDYEAPVAEYWPEFAAHGKHDITVRDVLSHRAGLHRVRGLVPGREGILDYGAVVTALAESPADPRRIRTSGYHAITFGWLVAEILQRATGESFTDLLHREVARPLGTDEFWFQVPVAQRRRIAKIFPHLAPPGIRWNTASSVLSWVRPVRGLAEAGMPESFDELVRDPRVHDAVMPGWNGVFSARALARMYGALANGGVVHTGDAESGTGEGDSPVQFLRPETIEQINRTQQTESRDYVLGLPLRFTLGYHRPVLMTKQQPRHAFGHYGVGGSGAYADPDLGMSIAFVTNRLGNAVTALGDARLAKLAAIAQGTVRRARAEH